MDDQALAGPKTKNLSQRMTGRLEHSARMHPIANNRVGGCLVAFLGSTFWVISQMTPSSTDNAIVMVYMAIFILVGMALKVVSAPCPCTKLSSADWHALHLTHAKNLSLQKKRRLMLMSLRCSLPLVLPFIGFLLCVGGMNFAASSVIGHWYCVYAGTFLVGMGTSMVLATFTSTMKSEEQLAHTLTSFELDDTILQDQTQEELSLLIQYSVKVGRLDIADRLSKKLSIEPFI
jgi:hypothetical protein